MGGMQFAEHRTARRFRSVIIGIVSSYVGQWHPPDRYGIVDSVDYALGRANVILGNDDTGTTWPFPRTAQPSAGDTVRVCGRARNRYIAAVTQRFGWADAAVQGDWTAGANVPQYIRNSDGFVQVRGDVGGGTGGTTAIALPEGYGIDASRTFLCASTSATGLTRVALVPDGSGGTLVQPGGTTSTINLDGILFDAN